MTFLRGEKAYEKYTWALLFAVGLVLLIYGMAVFAFGPFGPFGSRDPEDYRSFGSTTVALGVIVTAMSGVSYRRGEMWAWYALWAVPALSFVILASHWILGRIAWLHLFLLVVALLGLLLPYRKFFPKKQLSQEISKQSTK